MLGEIALITFIHAQAPRESFYFHLSQIGRNHVMIVGLIAINPILTGLGSSDYSLNFWRIDRSKSRLIGINPIPPNRTENPANNINRGLVCHALMRVVR